MGGRHGRGEDMHGTPHDRIGIWPEASAMRREARWAGLAAETVQFTATGFFEYGFVASRHLLIASDRGFRVDGESRVEGVVASARRDIGRTLSFIPKGHVFHGSFLPRLPPRSGYLYIDPAAAPVDPEIGFAEAEFEPRLFFMDQALWTTARKILRLVEDDSEGNRLYAETLAAALAIELVRSRAAGGMRRALARGGLAPWQCRVVCDFIRDNLDRNISLRELAALARLSPAHFCRAFARSMGMAPHRYQARQRVEQAKLLLADPRRPIEEVALACGYTAPSNFATAFRRVTGVTPREYRRILL